MKLRKVLSFSNRSDRLCSDDHGCGPSIYDLPVPLSLREEWRQLETRRHFLGKTGKTLGWAGLATLMGNSLLGTWAGAASEGASSKAALSSASNVGSVHLPNFVPKAKRCIHLF